MSTTLSGRAVLTDFEGINGNLIICIRSAFTRYSGNYFKCFGQARYHTREIYSGFFVPEIIRVA